MSPRANRDTTAVPRCASARSRELPANETGARNEQEGDGPASLPPNPRLSGHEAAPSATVRSWIRFQMVYAEEKALSIRSDTTGWNQDVDAHFGHELQCVHPPSRVRGVVGYTKACPEGSLASRARTRAPCEIFQAGRHANTVNAWDRSDALVQTDGRLELVSHPRLLVKPPARLE
eukprot:3212228-Prymnesium_polylepis.2